jgi:hypothetical protein
LHITGYAIFWISRVQISLKHCLYEIDTSLSLLVSMVSGVRVFFSNLESYSHSCGFYIFIEECEDTKGVSESVNRRKTDNGMTKRKRTKGQTTIYKTLHRKLKIE